MCCACWPRVCSCQIENYKGAPREQCALAMTCGSALLHVLADQLRHFEHRHLAPTSEHRAELVVCIDHAPFALVLQTIPLDVLPELLGDLGAGHRAAPNDGAEHCIGLHGSHERWIGLPLRAATLRSALP